MDTVDYSKLDPKLLEKLQEYEKRSPANRQIQTLQEIQSILEMLYKDMKNGEGKEERTTEDFRKIALEIRGYLKSLDDKEAPETPDTAKPMLEGLKELQRALVASIKGIQVKPQVDVAAPQVSVDAPKIDLKGVEKTIKELGKEFDKAIKAIPSVELPENKDYTEFFTDMLAKLADIETASRIKPQAPTTVKVTNVDGSAIGGSSGGAAKVTDAYGIQAISNDGTYKYFFFEADNAAYYIMRKHITNKVFTYTAGTGGYAAVYQSAILGPSGTPTWGNRGATF